MPRNYESNVNVQFNVLKDIDDISLTYAVGIEENQAKNYTVVLKRKVHFCKFLLQRTIDNTLALIYEDILMQGNFIKMCPLKRGSYILHQYHNDEERLWQKLISMWILKLKRQVVE